MPKPPSVNTAAEPADTGAQSPQGHEWVTLPGIGLLIRYCPSQLNIIWDNGSNLLVRFDATTTSAEVMQARDSGVIGLRIAVQMNAPRGANGFSIVLPFAAERAPGVQSLAEMLQSLTSTHRDSAPAAEAGVPAHSPTVTPDARPPAPQPDPVRIDVPPRHWADDTDWIGLYPTRETERLLVTHADPPAQPAEHPPTT